MFYEHELEVKIRSGVAGARMIALKQSVRGRRQVAAAASMPTRVG
jgi:hypothetical protein